MYLARGVRISISGSRPNDLATRIDSNVTMGYPAAKAERRNKSGRIGVYHRGWILDGAMSIKAPRLDWCKQERTIPAMINRNMTFPAILSATARTVSRMLFSQDKKPGRLIFPKNRSATMGINSK